MEQQISQLEARISDLKAFFDGRSNERLSFPLDLSSRKTLDFWKTPQFEGLLVATGRTFPEFIDIVTDLLAFGLEVMLNGDRRILFCMFELKEVSVNPLTDIFTNVSGAHNLQNGDLIAFTSAAVLPTGLSILFEYYIVNRTGTTFQVSLSKGGSPVNVTDFGTGAVYYGLQ